MTIRNSYNMPRSRPLLLLLLSLVFAAVAHAKGSVVVSKGHNEHLYRRLDDNEIGNEIGIEIGNDADADADGTRYNPCSLCQGLVLLADKIPVPDALKGFTCADVTAFFEKPKPIRAKEMVDSSGEFLSQDTTDNDVSGCRAGYRFNEMFTQCCRAPSFTNFQCEKNVHDYLFGGFGPYGEYNTAVPPIVGPENDQKLNVSVALQFEALTEVAVEEGTATMFVTMELKWNDPRLKWDVAGDTCSNSIEVYTGHEIETTSIWIPDFDVMNRIEGLQSMPNARAKVFSDGTVQWIVSGGLQAFCAFQGLANIPFDTLGCQLLFGSHMHSELINYLLEKPQYIFYGLFDVTYSEWSVVPELGEQGYAVNGDTIYYDVFFRRATQNYLSGIVLPTAILTYLSFLTFFLDVRVGERLGFGMALALVVVAQQIVTTGMTPVSNQGLWLDKFVEFSFYFVLVGVIQSVMIGFLYFIREDRREHEQLKTNTTPEETDEKELQPLTLKRTPDNDFTESVSIESGGSKPRIAAIEAPGKENAKKDFLLTAALKALVFKYPLRKIDMLAFFMSVVSYTVFVAVMISLATNNKWTGDEPKWFDETSHSEYSREPFINGDPNNR